MSARNFAKIPEDLLFDTELSPHAVRLYGILQRYAGRTGSAFPGREELAARLGSSVETVKRAMGELARSGWVERTRRPASNVWDTQLSDRPAHQSTGHHRPVPTGHHRPALSKARVTSDPTSGHHRPDGRVTTDPPEKQREPMNESQLTRVTASAADATSPDGAEVVDAEIIDELPLDLPAVASEPDPVQILVGAYVQAVKAGGGIATKSQRGAIGRNVKRLIADDGIPLPVLLVAVQRAGTKRARTVDPFLGDVQAAYDRASTRRAMFDRWAEIATRIDQEGQLPA